MKEYFVIVAQCYGFSYGKYITSYGQYKEYPSKEELEKCLSLDDVIWASVEKRYTNRPITYQGIKGGN